MLRVVDTLIALGACATMIGVVFVVRLAKGWYCRQPTAVSARHPASVRRRNTDLTARILIFEIRGASTGPGGTGNRMVFPVSRLGQRSGSRALIPPVPDLIQLR